MPRRTAAPVEPRDPKGDAIVVVEQRHELARRLSSALIDLGIAQSYADVLPARRYADVAAALRSAAAEIRSVRDAL